MDICPPQALPAAGEKLTRAASSSGLLVRGAGGKKIYTPAQVRFFTEAVCVQRACAGCREMGIRIFSKRSDPSISPNQRLTPQKPSAAAGPGRHLVVSPHQAHLSPQPSQIKSRLPSKGRDKHPGLFFWRGFLLMATPTGGLSPLFSFFLKEQRPLLENNKMQCV